MTPTHTTAVDTTLHQTDDPVPTITNQPAAQGDLLILPTTTQPSGQGHPIPPHGLTVVAGTHNHVAHGQGRWHPDWRACDLTIGLLEADGDIHLQHESQTGDLSGEHGTITIAAGTCVELRGQQESAREGGWRRVED